MLSIFLAQTGLLFRTKFMTSMIKSKLDAFCDKVRQRADVSQKAVNFWWRDDDACEWHPSLERYVGIAQQRNVPIALAVIMGKCSSYLADELCDKSQVDVLVHGWTHLRHDPNRNGEFTGMAVDVVKMRADMALHVGKTLFRSKLVPIFVPPWNVLGKDLYGTLMRAGYVGVSQFGMPDGEYGLNGMPFRRVDTHVDMMTWGENMGMKPEHQVVEELETSLTMDCIDAIGILTHHRNGASPKAVDLLCMLFDTLLAMPEVRFVAARQLFAVTRA